MGRGRDAEGGRPVEPGVARAHDNDPDAVEVRSAGDREGRPRVEGLGPDIPSSGPVGGRESHEEVRLSRGSAASGASSTGPRRLGANHDGVSYGDSIRWGRSGPV